MEKVRLMRVYNPVQGGMRWVPRKLWEANFVSRNIRKEPEWISRAIRLAEEFNRAERQSKSL